MYLLVTDPPHPCNWPPLPSRRSSDLQHVKSALLESRLPATFREPGGQWFGFSLRARVIVYNKAKVQPSAVQSYEALADAKWKDRICVRSSTNIYNLSLMSALIDRLGEAKAQEWARAARAN